MPHPEYAYCRYCRRHREECGPLSWTRQCIDCASDRLEANGHAMHSRSGPEYEHWARRTLMAAHRALVRAQDDAA